MLDKERLGYLQGRMEAMSFPRRAKSVGDGQDRYEIVDADDGKPPSWLRCRAASPTSDDRLEPSRRLSLVIDMACMVPELLDEIAVLREALSEVGEVD